MQSTSTINRGYLYAILAAVLFGASTPASKFLLGQIDPWLLAGLLYFGSGIGLLIVFFFSFFTKKATSEASLAGKDWNWLGGAIFFGGILAPVLLMNGLARTQASSASLLLNFEGVFTTLLAWFVFKEHFDRRIAWGMFFIILGGLAISWSGKPEWEELLGPLYIAAACLCWAIDNNLTRKISAQNPLHITLAKSVIAGLTNIGLAFLFGAKLVSGNQMVLAGLVGFFGYGLSLICFVMALRHIGTSRTGAYFSIAPFVGSGISLLVFLQMPSLQFLLSGLLMGVGVWLHLTERHDHEHEHEELEHAHKHVHDEHHQHEHGPNDSLGEPHTHWHKHTRLRHSHSHYPDIHHRHVHKVLSK
ncbi:DMT family transporter [bacterium]|nr:DMT family transporter [bacterium]